MFDIAPHKERNEWIGRKDEGARLLGKGLLFLHTFHGRRGNYFMVSFSIPFFRWHRWLGCVVGCLVYEQTMHWRSLRTNVNRISS